MEARPHARWQLQAVAHWERLRSRKAAVGEGLARPDAARRFEAPEPAGPVPTAPGAGAAPPPAAPPPRPAPPPGVARQAEAPAEDFAGTNLSARAGSPQALIYQWVTRRARPV